MSRVNLLPSEIKKGQENRRRFMLFLLAGIAIVLLVFAFWFIQSMRLSDVQDQVQAQNQVNAGIQQNIASLQQYEQLQTDAQQQEQLLAAAYAGEVSYSQMLLDVSKVIPSDTYLTTFASTLQAPTASTSTTTTTTFVGNMTFSGETLHFDSLSTWLNRLESVQGWANPWTSNVSADASVAGAFQFDTTVDLTQDALTERGAAGTAATGG
ncbi:MAG TPA: PilN domain-containing protein [Actinomycetota bacterium]|nr:PilN domain-containing protein [Actinomycetota bacterium]